MSVEEDESIKLRPFVSAGEIYLHDDGKTYEVVPISLFRNRDGAILRIGRNTYWFNDDGTYDGPECSVDLHGMPLKQREALTGRLVEVLDECKALRHQRPREAYFSPGSPGHEAEVSIWPRPEDPS